MPRPSPPLDPTKVRQVRAVLVAATVVLVVGVTVTAAAGHGLWVAGLVGWVVVAAAAGLGAGPANLGAALGRRAGTGEAPGVPPTAAVWTSDAGRSDGGRPGARRPDGGGPGGPPLPLPRSERGAADLETLLDAVLDDLAGSGVAVPVVGPAGTLTWPDGRRSTVGVRRADTAAERLADLAEQVQAGLDAAPATPGEASGAPASGADRAVWPACPRHPGAHRLTAGIRRRQAVWVCPTGDVPVARIGQLYSVAS